MRKCTLIDNKNKRFDKTKQYVCVCIYRYTIIIIIMQLHFLNMEDEITQAHTQKTKRGGRDAEQMWVKFGCLLLGVLSSKRHEGKLHQFSKSWTKYALPRCTPTTHHSHQQCMHLLIYKTQSWVDNKEPPQIPTMNKPFDQKRQVLMSCMAKKKYKNIKI